MVCVWVYMFVCVFIFYMIGLTRIYIFIVWVVHKVNLNHAETGERYHHSLKKPRGPGACWRAKLTGLALRPPPNRSPDSVLTPCSEAAAETDTDQLETSKITALITVAHPQKILDQTSVSQNGGPAGPNKAPAKPSLGNSLS